MRQTLPKPRRTGMALLFVVIALAMLSVMLGATTWQFLAHRRTLERRLNQAQAQWLARAGIERAVARLLAEPGAYKGETMELVPGSQLRIAVLGTPGPIEFFDVTSEARFPADVPSPVVRSITRRLRRTVEGNRYRIAVVAAEAAKPGTTP